MGTIEEEVFGCCDKLSSIRKLEPLSENGVVLPWSEQLGRLKVWIEENRIASDGRTSLEESLEGCSHIVHALTELLSTLKHTVQSCTCFSATHWYMLTVVKGIDLNLEFILATVEGTHDTSPSEDMTDNLEILTDTLDSLYDLSSNFANPVAMDMLTDPVFQAIDELAETFDVAHVEAKYPSAPLPLVRRLGSMNIRRRSSLWYQKRKNETSRSGLREAIHATSAIGSLARLGKSYSTDPSTVLSLASSVFDTPVNANHLDTVDSQSSASISQLIKKTTPCNTGPVDLSLISETEPSAISNVKSSVSSATSFAVTITPSSEARARVPRPPPKFYEDQPFECIYCFKVLKTVKTHRAWKYDAHMELVRDHHC
jgi:hypothetical protein